MENAAVFALSNIQNFIENKPLKGLDKKGRLYLILSANVWQG